MAVCDANFYELWQFVLFRNFVVKLTMITRMNKEKVVEKGHEIDIVPAYDWLVGC
ncbi:MAG: hypothetical protein HUK15_08470 [Bacteroidales bacterium]|nr:hypothetical protein [Bacteroidales bacterium]